MQSIQWPGWCPLGNPFRLSCHQKETLHHHRLAVARHFVRCRLVAAAAVVFLAVAAGLGRAFRWSMVFSKSFSESSVVIAVVVAGLRNPITRRVALSVR